MIRDGVELSRDESVLGIFLIYHWFRYVDDINVKIQKSELDSFFNHLNPVDPNIKFTQEGVNNSRQKQGT